MKKTIRNIVLTIIFSFIGITNVNAATANINITSSSTKIVTGNTFTVKVTTSSSSILGTVQYDLSYNSKVLKLTKASSSLCNPSHCIWNTIDTSTKSTTYTFTFKAIGTGTSTITVKDIDIVGFDEKRMSQKVSPASVTVITQEQLEASYSKNNYLSNLTVSGYTLSPKFYKDTLKYTLELDSTVEKIKINATKADSRATISGTGNKIVSEGENKLNVIVTAENGSKRTYTIIATVKELNPIKVNVNDQELTVVKKSKSLPKVEDYEESTIEINNTIIPVYKSNITNYTLIGLKDNEGEINLYIFDEENNTYELYKEYKFGSNKIRLLDTNETIEGYKETTIKIDEDEIKAFKKDENSEFSIIYGVNLLTGIKGFYKYDSVDDTIQRFDTSEIVKKSITTNLKISDNEIILLTIIGLLSIILLITIISSLLKPKKKKKDKEEKIEKKKEPKKDDKTKTEVKEKKPKTKKKSLEDIPEEDRL